MILCINPSAVEFDETFVSLTWTKNKLTTQ
jgi:hypothetical protein